LALLVNNLKNDNSFTTTHDFQLFILTMSLQCAISGEPLTVENAEDIVVTPSGHICFKRLILTKLSENGGVDPFSDSGRPLSEDELVSLQTSKNRPNMPPPPASITSFSGTLKQLANEYDAVLLELFDTRKTLKETRRELSQALYQNDAAIRVIARLSMERDAARQESQRFQSIAGASGNTMVNGKPTNQEDGEAEAPSKKKPRLEGDESAELPLSNDVPTSDLDIMLGAWEKLSTSRRSKPKSTYTLPLNWTVANTQSWHKSTCRGITAMAQTGKFITTAGKDKHIMVYDSEGQVVAATISSKVLVHSLDTMPKEEAEGALLIVAACGDELRVYDSSTEDVIGTCDLSEQIVSACGHPTNQHCVAVTKSGKAAIFRVGGAKGLQQISTFSQEGAVYSCGTLHPDGLILAAGTSTGQIALWDLKNKMLASTIPVSLTYFCFSFLSEASVPQLRFLTCEQFLFPLAQESVESEDALVKIAFSSNGYHVAVAHASGAVRVWDMRKNKLLAELNTSGDDVFKDVSALAFHEDGKYLAYGGHGGASITMVKEWKVLASLDIKVATDMLWSSQWITTVSDKGRTVSFHQGQ